MIWYLKFEPGVAAGSFARASTAYELRQIQAPDDAPSQECMIGYPIHSDQGTLSGGDWEATMPLSRMQNRDTTDRARSTNDSTSAAQFLLDLGPDPDDWLVGAIGIFAHNLTKDALLRIAASDESDVDPPVYESGWLPACAEIYPSGVLLAGEPGYSDGFPAAAQPNIPILQFIPAGTAARYWLFEFDDQSNPDGYIEIGRLMVCFAWQLGQNFEVGSALDVLTLTTRDESEGGQFYHDERPQRRFFVGEFSHLDEDEALVRVHDFKMLVGTSRQFLWVERPAEPYHRHRGAYPAVMEKLSPLEYPEAYQKRKQAVAILEEM